MATFRGNLRTAAAVLLLEADTIAGANIFLPRDWPLNTATMPALSLQTPRWSHEDRTNGVGSPQFWSTVRLDVHCQLQEKGGADAAALVEEALDTLADQVETALAQLIVGPPQLFRRLVQVVGNLAIDSSGESHVGIADLAFDFEYANDIEPVITERLTEIRIAAIRRMRAGDHAGSPLMRVLAGADIAIPQ